MKHKVIGHNYPFIISLYFLDDLSLLSGQPVLDAISLIMDHGALAVGFNCIAPNSFNKLMTRKILSESWGFYLNCGSGHPEDEIIECGVSPETYLESVKENLEYSPSFIGACCGSGFEHIRNIREFLDGKD